MYAMSTGDTGGDLTSTSTLRDVPFRTQILSNAWLLWCLYIVWFTVGLWSRISSLHSPNRYPRWFCQLARFISWWDLDRAVKDLTTKRFWIHCDQVCMVLFSMVSSSKWFYPFQGGIYRVAHRHQPSSFQMTKAHGLITSMWHGNTQVAEWGRNN